MINSRQLPLAFWQRKWFPQPPTAFTTAWEVCDCSPHMYVWFMAARVIDGYGVVDPYTTPFSTTYSDLRYRPFDSSLLPSGLLEDAL
jgi:hypothetical protein